LSTDGEKCDSGEGEDGNEDRGVTQGVQAKGSERGTRESFRLAS
jgi:hypothetical protein